MSERIYRVRYKFPDNEYHPPYRVRYFTEKGAETQKKRLENLGAIVQDVEKSQPVVWDSAGQQALPL